jgi:diguanylate cyclase (GGDEF)-like protein
MGDRALQRVAAALHGGARSTDAVGRLGGDEFLVVLPDTPASGGRAHAERLRGLVDAELRALPGLLTVSMGAATYPDDGADAGGLLRVADLALYEHKRRRDPMRTGGSVTPAPRGQPAG